MQKSFKKPSPLQYVILLVVIMGVAYLRNHRFGENQFPSGEPTATASLPQIHVNLPPTQNAPTDTPTRAPKPTLEQPPTATNSAVTVPTDQLSKFDYFVLALSWSPDYCATNGTNDPQQCSIGKKLGFVLHGLWPQYDKGYPSNCSTEKMPGSVKAQFPGLYPNDSLFDHEWEKHGTCTGLSPVEYLQTGKALKESVVVPSEFRSPATPFRTSADQLKTLFAQANPGFSEASFEVSCSSSGRYVKEIYVCFSRDGAATACSAEMHKTALKSCQAADFLVRNTR